MTWINGLSSIDCVKLKAFNAFYGPQISPNNPNKRVVFFVSYITTILAMPPNPKVWTPF